MLWYALAQQLAVVGEAAARISAELHQRHPSLPWSGIIGFRNVVVHEYFGIDWPVVWQTATEQAPELHRQVAEIVRNEFGYLTRVPE